MYNYAVADVINLWKINKAKKKLSFKIKFTKKNFRILNLMVSINLINRLSIINENKSMYILSNICYYQNNQIAPNFKVMSTPSKSFFISLRALNLIHKRTLGSKFLLSNSSGIITHVEAVRIRKGGLLVGFVSI